MTMESRQDVQVRETTMASIQEYNEQETTQNNQVATYNGVEAQNGQEENYAVTIEEMQPDKPTVEEYAAFKREEEAMVEEQKRMEKEKKIETWNKIWPWGDTKSLCRKYRINFMKYEKPPVSLDHLQNSATYKLIHNMEEEPMRRVDQLTPVVAEADYRERCRSATPCVTNGRM